MLTNKSEVVVLGGERKFLYLHSNNDAKTYAVKKAQIWMRLISEYERPTKWYRASKTGTRVAFESFRTSEDYANALDELDVYLKQVNEEYGTDMKIIGRHKEDSE